MKHIAQAGWYDIGGKHIYFRSQFERRYAKLLQLMKESGEIQDWEYEADEFWFENIRRGVRSYKPDFKVTGKDGKIWYVETKGYLDSKSKTKLKRMAKYYPHIDLRLVKQ